MHPRLRVPVGWKVVMIDRNNQYRWSGASANGEGNR
jgi:hypothetical protein